MPRKPIKFNLDFMRKDIFSRFTVKQFDDVTFTITPLINNEPYNVSNMACKIYVGVNNEMYKQDTNITVSSNSIVVTLDKNMLSKDGRAYAEIELTDSNGTVTSSSFIFDIDRKIGEGASIPGAIDGFVAKYEKLTEEFKNRFNELTASQQQDAEVIDARKGETSLRTKIDKIDEQFNTKASINTTNDIQRQLNDLVLESGGDSNLEVVQSRNNYSNLNDRLNEMNNVTDLINAQINGFEEMVKPVYVKKMVDYSTGELIVGNRVVSNIFTPSDYFTLISKTSYKYMLLEYDSNETYIGKTEWLTLTNNTFISPNIKVGYKYRIMFDSLTLPNNSTSPSVADIMLNVKIYNKLASNYEGDLTLKLQNVSTFDDLELTSGYYINSIGQQASNENCTCSDFIAVKKGTLINYKLSGSAGWGILSVYNKNKRFIRTIVLGNGWTDFKEGVYEVESGISYIRFSFVNVHKDTCYVKITNDFSQYKLIENIFKSIDEVKQSNIKNSIIEKNKDIEDIIYASCDYKRKFEQTKLFTLAVAGDIHKTTYQMENIIKYMNEITPIDAGIMLGDMSSNNFYEGTSNWYADIIKNATKPFLTVIGNHDAGSTNSTSTSYRTKEELYNKWIANNIEYANLSATEKTGECYYYKDFADYKIRMIILNQYDYPSDLGEDGNYIYNRGKVLYSQEQINWFCNTLLNTPSNYHVIICVHSDVDVMKPTQHLFTTTSKTSNFGNNSYIDEPIIPDIVNVFINGSSLNKTYNLNVTSQSISRLNVNIDFSSRGKGNFICYLGGHYHTSMISTSINYPNQQLYSVDVSGLGKYNLQYTDTPRVEGTKSEDCFCTLAVDTDNRRINIVRVGAHMTRYMEDRIFTSIKY